MINTHTPSEPGKVFPIENNEITNRPGASKPYDMVVFCHLRWEFVFQRPQHIISRMAETYNVLFVEEPIGCTPENKFTANEIRVSRNLTVVQPYVDTLEETVKVLARYINGLTPIAWFYSPAFYPLLNSFKFARIVYDCMDELSLFKGAPKELINSEKQLLAAADIVFTGGKSLYEAKNKLHPNVYCFPSSVERAHFEKALNGITIPEDIAGLPKPVVGYYGVIDERIDYELLERTAQKNPSVSFVMIGPLAKVEQKDLPAQKNIYYLGMRNYKVLPNYLKGFDIAMMPFAMNDATKFISPTKTLEYMAAGKPVISTPVYDVVRDYSECVTIVNTEEEFSDALANEKERTEHIKMYNAVLNKTSWDNTVQRMKELLIKNTVVYEAS